MARKTKIQKDIDEMILLLKEHNFTMNGEKATLIDSNSVIHSRDELGDNYLVLDRVTELKKLNNGKQFELRWLFDKEKNLHFTSTINIKTKKHK